MEIEKLADQLQTALRDQFDDVGVTGPVDVGQDEDSIVLSLSADQAQALLDALYRSEEPRRTP